MWHMSADTNDEHKGDTFDFFWMSIRKEERNDGFDHYSTGGFQL